MSNKAAQARFKWTTAAILLLAAALRLINLFDVPPGLSQDEVLNADIVKFILGGEHALFFRHGFGHEPLYHYFSVPFQVLLGDNGLAIRLPAVFLGVVLIALTMVWARREYGNLAALLAGLGMATSWWAIIFSRVGIRPILEPVLLVAAAWAWPRRAWLAGILLGLSVYSYTAARTMLLLPLLLVFYLLLVHHRGRAPSRPSADSYRSKRSALIVLLIALAIFGPLWLTLQADPSLQQRVDQLSGPLEALRRGDVEPVLAMTAATLGVFSFTGDPRWTYSLPGRPLFDPLTSIVFLIGAAVVIWRWRRPKYALLLIWFGLALLPSALSPDAPSTIRLIGILPITYLLIGIGGQWMWQRWQRWLEKRKQSKRHLVFLPAVLLALVLGINLWRTIQDGFVRWPEALETRLRYQSVTREIADHWQRQGQPALVVADSYFEPIDADSLNRNLGFDPGARWIQSGQDVMGAIVVPNQPDKNTRLLYVPEYAPLAPRLLEAAGIDVEPAFRSAGQPAFAVYDLSEAGASPSVPKQVAFDERMTFLGYDVLQQDEEEIRLLSYWRVDGSLPPDLSIFVHLVNGQGEILAQHDGLDVAVQLLEPGDIVIQYHVLPLSGNTPIKLSALEIGLYERGSQRRWTHAGQPQDRVIINDG